MSNKPKILMTVVLSFILVTSQAGCGLFKQTQKKILPGGGKQQQQKKSEKLKIGVSMATTEGDGYAILKKTMDGLKKKNNAEITWKDARNDPMEQAVNVDELIKKKVKAVVLQPVNPKASAELVDKLQQKDIKVVALEKLPLNTPLDGYITPDYARAGELQGQAVAKQMQEGQVLLLAGDQDQKSAKDMLASFEEYLQTNTKTTIATIKPQGYLDSGTARQVVSTGLSRYPTPKAIVTQDPALTTALLEYLKVSPMAPKPFTVGIGGHKTVVKAMMNNQHEAEVDIRPDLLAAYAMEAAVRLSQDGHLDYDQKIKNDSSDVPVREIPVRLITKDNIYLMKAMWGKELEKEKGKKPEEKSKQEESGGSSGQGSEKSSQGQDSKGQSSEGDQAGGEGQKGEQKGQKGKMTKLKITTKEGRTMEIEVPGDVQSIETKMGESGKGQGEKSGGQESEAGSASKQ